MFDEDKKITHLEIAKKVINDIIYLQFIVNLTYNVVSDRGDYHRSEQDQFECFG